MRRVVLASLVAAVSASFSFGAAHASTNPLTFTSSTSVTGEHRQSAMSAVESMLNRFIKIDAKIVASAGAHSGADECPTNKEETKVADADKQKETDKTAPQGPEPIYFAF